METANRHASGWCCTDCLFLLANGDTPDHMTEAEVAEYLARVDLALRFGPLCCVLPS